MTAAALTSAGRTRPRIVAGVSRLLLYTFLLAFVLYVLSPFLAILVTSVAQDWFGGRVLPGSLTLRWFDWAFNVTNLPRVMGNSFLIAGLTIVISLGVGLPTAWALGRRQVRARNVLMTLILLPRTVPPITFALGLSRQFYSFDLVDTHLGVALAHATLALPFVVLIMSATFQGLDERVLEAGRVCGGNWFRNLVHLVLPMATPGLMAAVLFTFVTSFNEFTLTLVTYGPDTLTLTVQTYLAIGDGFFEVASAISVALLVPSVLLLILIQRQIRPENLLGGVKGL